MAKAAMASHAASLHWLAVIQFNGSGGTKRVKDLRAGVALCARAAAVGQVDAMRDLGHCLQDGYGVQRNITEGRRLFLEANSREVAAAGINPPLACLQTALNIRSSDRHPNFYSAVKKDSGQHVLLHNHQFLQHPMFCVLQRTCCSLLSDFACNVPPAEPHIANKFFVGWFSLFPPPPGLRLCSNENCGRLETRRHGFRRFSACSSVNYCSRARQALDWKICHRHVCTATENWDDMQDNDVEEEELLNADESRNLDHILEQVPSRSKIEHRCSGRNVFETLCRGGLGGWDVKPTTKAMNECIIVNFPLMSFHFGHFAVGCIVVLLAL